MSDTIQVKIIENSDKVDWNIYFLVVALLALIAAVVVPFFQKKYEERKAKYGFHLYIKKRIGVLWNILTYDQIEYKQFVNEDVVISAISFDKFISQFEKDYKINKSTIHPHFAFGILLNLQSLLFIVNRVKSFLKTIDIKNLEEKTLEYGDKLSKKELNKLTELFILFQHYDSVTSFHDKFGSLKSVIRKIKDTQWVGIIVENSVLNNQALILNDLKYLSENESSMNNIININKLLIQALKLYFDYNTLMKKKKKLTKTTNRTEPLTKKNPT
jgi:hypothetical protein